MAKSNFNQLISESITFEAYFNLWGFSMNWINTIQEKLLDFSEPSKGDNCEAYTCDACMAVRFQSTDKSRVESAKKLFKRLAMLASRSYNSPNEVIYVVR